MKKQKSKQNYNKKKENLKSVEEEIKKHSSTKSTKSTKLDETSVGGENSDSHIGGLLGLFKSKSPKQIAEEARKKQEQVEKKVQKVKEKQYSKIASAQKKHQEAVKKAETKILSASQKTEKSHQKAQLKIEKIQKKRTDQEEKMLSELRTKLQKVETEMQELNEKIETGNRRCNFTVYGLPIYNDMSVSLEKSAPFVIQGTNKISISNADKKIKEDKLSNVFNYKNKTDITNTLSYMKNTTDIKNIKYLVLVRKNTTIPDLLVGVAKMSITDENNFSAEYVNPL